MLRVVIADDHEIVRTGIRRLLGTDPRIRIVAEASNGQLAVAAVEKHHPDLLLLDLSMPGGHGLDVIATIGRQQSREAWNTRTKILILTGHDDELTARFAARAGAAGFVSKKTRSQELLDTVWRVASGERVGLDDRPTTTDDELTPRELEVLLRLARGDRNSEVAAELGISVKTIDSHRHKILRKLDLRNNSDLTRYAIRAGLIDG